MGHKPATIRIPTVSQCLSLMDEHGMLDNIRAHSLMVARVADTLYHGLDTARSGRIQPPEHGLVLAGALLHDIAKTPCLGNTCDHARQGRDICAALGYPEVGEIVREHVILRDFSPERYGRGQFQAKEIVYYADKRVCHDEIVPLHQRLDYIVDRYARNDHERQELIRANFQRCVILEGYLFAGLDFQPEDLKKQSQGHDILVDHDSREER